MQIVGKRGWEASKDALGDKKKMDANDRTATGTVNE